MDKVIMNAKEREQLLVFDKLKSGAIKQVEAALKLELTPRWVRTKYRRYLAEGAAGLVHKNRGKPSPNRWNDESRALLIDLLKTDWHGFGPTFVRDKLLQIYKKKKSVESIRQMMIEEGFWKKGTRKTVHRKRRERKERLGTMIQFDGSPHKWFEDRASACTLLVFIDDATSKILWLEFVKSESYVAVTTAVKHYLEKYGRSLSYYVDYGSVFSVNTNNPDRDKLTQFERGMKELGITVIHARSPQAKGRVERANGILQDRLVKDMRIAKISSIEDANTFVQDGGFLEDHNERFAVDPARPGDLHRPLAGYDLDNILC